MKEKRLIFGAVLTVAWLGFMGYMLCTRVHPTGLNEWGDLFAGFFAPLAFLWLVLGYLQQGEELKHSTKALELQAQELKHSVEQQTALVDVSRQQVQQEREALQDERARRRDAARPIFVPKHDGGSSTGGKWAYKLKITNVGNTATDVLISFDPPIEDMTGVGVAVMARHQDQDVKVSFAHGSGSTATIKYIDADGEPGEVRFSMQVGEKQHQLALGKVERVQ